MENKENFYIVLIAFGITSLTWFFSGTENLFGSTSSTIHGFPFHFIEVGKSLKFVPLGFIADLVWYLAIIVSLRYLINLGTKNKNWTPVTITVVLGILVFFFNITKSSFCESGFPIEFYSKCDDGSAGYLYILAGVIISPVFWFSVSAVCVAFIRWFCSRGLIMQFLMHKNVSMALWVCFFVLVLGVPLGFAGIIEGWGLLGFFICAPGIYMLNNYLEKRRGLYKDTAKKFFFSRFGYIIFGIFLGLMGISTFFNLGYQGDWFDFTDIGFYFLSFPFGSMLHFSPDSDSLSKRLVLYVIVAVNLISITFILDVVALFLKSFKDKKIF